MRTKDYQNGLHDGVAVALGYFAVSFAFGMEAVTKGLGILQAMLISLTNVTSAGQFSGLGIIAAGGMFIELALTQLVINLRYCLMSFSLAQKLDRSAPNWHRYLMAYSVTDEIFALDASLNSTLEASLPLRHHQRRCSRLGSGYTGGRRLWNTAARLCDQRPRGCDLRHVPCHHHTACTAGPHDSDCRFVRYGAEFSFFCPPGTQPSLIGLCHHYHNGRGRRHRSMAKANSRGRKQRRKLK